MGGYMALLLIIACDLFRTTREGLIENLYIAKITNLDPKPHSYALQAEGIRGSYARSLLRIFSEPDSLREEAQ